MQAQPGHTVAAPPGGKKVPGRQGLEKPVEVAMILQTLFFAVTRPPQVAPDQCAAHSRRSASAPSVCCLCCSLEELTHQSVFFRGGKLSLIKLRSQEGFLPGFKLGVFRRRWSESRACSSKALLSEVTSKATTPAPSLGTLGGVPP